MFRFSCFNANVQSNKAKKTIQPSTEAMVKALQDGTQNQGSKDSSNPTSSYSSPSREQAHKQINIENQINNWDSVEHSCRSEDLDILSPREYDNKVYRTRGLKKSQSLQSGLDQGITEGDEDLGLSCDDSKSHNESTISICRKCNDAYPIDQYEKNPNEFQVSSGLANDGSIFSIGDPMPSDKDVREISDTPLSGELVGDTGDQIPVPGTLSLMKSCSLPNIRASIFSAGKDALKRSSLSRSSEDLHALCIRQKEVFINEYDDQTRGDQERENDMGKTEDGHMDSFFDDGFDSYLLSGSAKDWVMPITDDTSDIKTLHGHSSVEGEFPNKDFKIKRIEDWVTGLQHCGPPVEETNELAEPIEPSVNVNTINVATAATVDHKTTPGMEAAKRYISSLSANATAAQLANHGLVVIPFLSAFVSLKVLNLAGNAIVRITAGALPRGLHMLNLSRNNISTIEGLRELTRLRVLDLSYNRILRIGHGLASCSSLKELYVAGNKISEVEGLHRLLKLSILDLRFNKISTAKCLGQLAANYNSLQAINLEGNPAQKNVGDEQLKKYLQGLLPHLVYYNRQSIKVNTLKDGAERSIRYGINSHQFDRSSIRADRKTTRKSNHSAVTSRRASTASTHARRSVDSPKLSKGKQGLLPPTGSKVSAQSRHQFDALNKVSNSTLGQSMRKSRSEGTLGAQ